MFTIDYSKFESNHYNSELTNHITNLNNLLLIIFTIQKNLYLYIQKRVQYQKIYYYQNKKLLVHI